jgi:hypothetical protein
MITLHSLGNDIISKTLKWIDNAQYGTTNTRGCTVRTSLVILKYYYKQKEFDDKEDYKLVPPWNQVIQHVQDQLLLFMKNGQSHISDTMKDLKSYMPLDCIASAIELYYTCITHVNYKGSVCLF